MTREVRPPLDSIPLAEIREGELNVRVLGSGRKIMIFKEGAELRIFHEVCPHMGGDLSEGVFCAKNRTIQCPWHGYLYSTEDGRFLSNPNERFTALLRTPTAHFKPEKTPRYRMSPVAFAIIEDRIVLGKEGQGAERAVAVEEARESDGGAR